MRTERFRVVLARAIELLEKIEPGARAAEQRTDKLGERLPSIGGLGGCPFAPGAAGNVATEDLVNMFESAGCATGIDLERLAAAVTVAEHCTGQALGGRWCNWHRSLQRAAAVRH